MNRNQLLYLLLFLVLGVFTTAALAIQHTNWATP